ncbi:rhodanese-like domain-containing protein [Neptuniibacter sp. SY11_33]|uniref:rhodanese-like domain-containing protein n=1 Tax=Neptuniibacter sp. SY11_33 TaxID=3398215 RepID=UPI0039F58A90
MYLYALLLINTGFAENQSDYADTTDFELFSAEGYRLFHYRSPTPLKSLHGKTLSTEDVIRLLETGNKPIFVDVQPIPWNRVFIQKEPRLHIPGSLWLPNVGFGELDDDWSEYFQSNLERLTNGDKSLPVIIYCTADCWMSWNALKRASEWGYTNLLWYRNGSDGWIEHDLETSIATPEPFTLKKH